MSNYMALVIGHVDLAALGTNKPSVDIEHDIPWAALARLAHSFRGHYAHIELISRPGILLNITHQGISQDVAGYAHLLFDGGLLVVHTNGTVEHYDVRETADETCWAFIYPNDSTMLPRGTSGRVTKHVVGNPLASSRQSWLKCYQYTV